MGRVVCLFLVAQGCLAQPAFEVASVKPCKVDAPAPGGRKGDGGGSSPARLHLTCQTLKSLIQWAYVNFANDRFEPLAATPISGGPDWVDSERYQIDATTDGPRSSGFMNGRMLRAILEDRFQLATRRETRQVPVYALMVAGNRAPRLKPFAQGSCTPFDNDNPPEPGKPFPHVCGMGRITMDGFDVEGVTIPVFARLLWEYFDRKVVDKTGIPGKFNIHLAFTPEPSDPSSIEAGIKSAVRAIGFRLVPTLGSDETLMIVHAEKPTAN